MTGMLASVSSVAEAKIVLNEVVDIIDLKNPKQGALGALHNDLIVDIVKVVNGLVTTSATIGDVTPDDPELLRKIEQMAATGVDIVKVGLFGTQPTEHFLSVIKEANNKNINIVVVIFAEDYFCVKPYESLLNCKIKGVMLDTRNKKSENLNHLLRNDELADFVTTVKEAGLLTGLAGSLNFDDIQSLLKLMPDYLGFRGALCSENNRVNEIDSLKVKSIRDAIPLKPIMDYAYSNQKEEVMSNGAVA